MTITAAEREFLSQDYRYVEIATSAVKTRHPEAREADRRSNVTDATGALAILTPIHTLLSGNNRLISVTVSGILDLSFKQRPPLITLLHGRFGLSAGRTMICQGMRRNRIDNQTTLFLYG